MSNPPRLVALDIDGTLVSSGIDMTERTRAAVAFAAEREHVVLATGRTAFGAAELLDVLPGADILAVCSNGAVLRYPDARTEIRTTFDPKPVVGALLEALPGAEFAVEVPGFGNIHTGLFGNTELSGNLRTVELDELVAAKCPRLIAKWGDRSQRDIAAALTTVSLPDTTATLDYGSQAWLTCVAAGTSKASALEEIRVRLGVSTSDTAAIGDGTNDIEMLEWAARGVAMGGAPEIVTTVADAVTGTLEQDGVAQALQHWFG